MPTPTGMLKAGDRLTHPMMPATTFVVVSRTSSSKDYVVRFRREDRKPFTFAGRDSTEHMLLNAYWKVFHEPGGWSLVEDAPAKVSPDATEMAVQWAQHPYHWEGKRAGITLFTIAYRVNSSYPMYALTCHLPGLNGKDRVWRHDDLEHLKGKADQMIRNWMINMMEFK